MQKNAYLCAMGSNAPYNSLNPATRGATPCDAVKGIFTPLPLTNINTSLTLFSSSLLGFGWDVCVCAYGVVDALTTEVMELGILGGGRGLIHGSGRRWKLDFASMSLKMIFWKCLVVLPLWLFSYLNNFL